MNPVKCVHCRLSNVSTDLECRRCGKLLYRPTDRVVSEKPPLRNTLISLLIFTALAAAGFYIYQGMKASVDEVSKGASSRVTAKPSKQPDAGLSRAAADRQRSERVANAVGASSGLNEHAERTRQTEKAIDQATNSNQR